MPTIHKRSTFFLGLFIILVPFLGLPTASKTTLIVIAGLFLIYSSVTITLPDRFKKTPGKPIVKSSVKRKPKKEKISTVTADGPVYSENDSVDSPKMPDIE